jgi:type I restriction enzyme S subunit
MSVDIKVPEIRFKGFGGDWDEKKLGTDIAEIIGGGTPSTSISEFWGGDIDWYSPTEIGSNVYAEGSQKKITDIGLKSSSAKILPADITVLFTSRAGIGDMAILAKPGATNQGFQSFIVKEGFSPYFLYSAGKLIKEFALKHASGSTFLEISGKQLGRMKILMPNKGEQSVIGNYFQKLDSLISQHQQKHDQLTNIKKAMLERMFPKQGKTIPETRFKGFSGEWEEKELGELAEIVRGASPRPIEDPKWFDSQSSVGWLRIRDVTAQDGRIYHLEQRISKLGQEKTRVLCEKHLLLSIAASVGKPVVNYVETGVHDGFLIFKKPLFELEFMYQWLKSFESKWQQYGQPGSQVNLNSNIVKSQIVVIPSNGEQLEIGNYFQKLDALVNQHQQQITKLNNIKQACLRKMFV